MNEFFAFRGGIDQSKSVLMPILSPILVLLFTKAVGRSFRWLHQSEVIGEICAGLLLGPSVFGAFLPDLHRFFFLNASTLVISWVGFIAVAAYLFLVGMGLSLRPLFETPRAILLIAAGSIFVPFLFGATAAPLFAPYYETGLSAAGGINIRLFMGVAFSITALPVLIRILKDENLMLSRLGETALTVAMIGDICSWIFLTVAVVAHEASTVQPGTILSHVSLCLFFFGGLLFHRWKAEAAKIRLEALLQTWLIPLFFASAGMKTRLDQLNWAQDFPYLLFICLIAINGKVFGTYFLARFSRAHPESFALGILMNTRGLVELIVLAIGMQAGLLSVKLYSLFILMAVLTTLMTTPLLRWLLRAYPHLRRPSVFRILT
jgi:Kef-type K+ transport system membrane component KefB